MQWFQLIIDLLLFFEISSFNAEDLLSLVDLDSQLVKVVELLLQIVEFVVDFDDGGRIELSLEPVSFICKPFKGHFAGNLDGDRLFPIFRNHIEEKFIEHLNTFFVFLGGDVAKTFIKEFCDLFFEIIHCFPDFVYFFLHVCNQLVFLHLQLSLTALKPRVEDAWPVAHMVESRECIILKHNLDRKNKVHLLSHNINIVCDFFNLIVLSLK